MWCSVERDKGARKWKGKVLSVPHSNSSPLQGGWRIHFLTCSFHPLTVCISYLLPHNKLPQNGLKQHYPLVSVIQDSRCSLAGCLCLRTAVKVLAGGCVSSHGLTGKGSASKVTHMVASRIQFFRGCTSPHGPLHSAAHNMAAEFHQPKQVRGIEKEREKPKCFCNLISPVKIGRAHV